MLPDIAAVVLAFLIGSIPVGVIVGRTRGVNIRQQGSGNIGATNALRVMGWRVGLFVLAADISKGLATVLLARLALHLDPAWVTATGVAAVIGHCFSPFLGFDGGKGVATAFGMILAIDWRVGIIAFVFFAVVLALTRYVSLGSIIVAATLWAVCLALHGETASAVGFAVVGGIIIQRHSGNIKRLLAGTENKFGKKARAGQAAGGGASE